MTSVRETSRSSPRKFAVIGAGPMGLMAGVLLLDAGHEVDIYEKDDRIGGMSAAFDFDGLNIERYYHFICKTDFPLFGLLERYGLTERLKWVDTRMGYFYNGHLYAWGNPAALLRFPHLGIVDKMRYAIHVLHAKNIDDWSVLEKHNATTWIRKWVGARAYQVLWESAFRLKFFEYADNLSASWIGTRIKRIALSRRSLMHESLGYLQGGSMVLLDAMAEDIRDRGGRIHLGSGLDEVVAETGRVTGVRIGQDVRAVDAVISTAPIQYVPRFVPTLPLEFRAQIEAVANIPVACVVLKLRKPISENFWLNINDPDIEVPGVIEYSNLNPGDGTAILYAPFYMPKTHSKWSLPDRALIDEVIGYLPRINTEFDMDWVLASHCHRYEFAQTICPPGFQSMLPPMRTPLEGFFMADTAYYYPEDRSISESIEVGRRLVLEALR